MRTIDSILKAVLAVAVISAVAGCAAVPKPHSLDTQPIGAPPPPPPLETQPVDAPPPPPPVAGS
ncbi:hypothetical protein [Asticcacaulis sp. 201]|uniref:hypothetical protein n=1 Tax=Asticcacaulis sp. 201 TaxID=3028787 RepID=UPI002916AFC6|nr:hypothetical protein [Asticcacaulis sp. 201]MDV6332755.1 hypothetical protein [Asticcacaulis sp. 201]